MNRNEIQESAEAFADRIDDGVRTARQCAIMAYKEGAGLKESEEAFTIWHNATEIPVRKGDPYIGVTAKRRRFVQFIYTSDDGFLEYVKRRNIERWAYKKDLLSL